MINPTRRRSTELLRGLAAIALGGAVLVTGGCSSEEPEEVVVQTPVKRAPKVEVVEVVPTVEPVDSIKLRLGIDPRVNLAEDKAPESTEARIAVLRFFDGFARGDASRLDGLMSDADALILEQMVDAGTFTDATGRIMGVKLETGSSPDFGDCALAVYMMNDGTFETQLWSYAIEGDPEGDGPVFDALPSPPNMLERLSGDDWITAWIQILEDELARATEPDEIVEFTNTDLTEETESGSSPAGFNPGGGGGPGRKKPTGPKVNPNPGGPGGPIGR
ncbi:MAG: hypothetical protein VX672_00580 [Planctomycetota bacterium]|nr:hypothetical protein [Planctomycetota bacterium]